MASIQHSSSLKDGPKSSALKPLGRLPVVELTSWQELQSRDAERKRSRSLPELEREQRLPLLTTNYRYILPPSFEYGLLFSKSPSTMAIKKITVSPYRRGSASSEDDFFDIPDEPCLAVVKRQLRRIRTWAIFALFTLLILLYRRYSASHAYLESPVQYDRVNWSRFAYSQYATSSAYLCSALMVFDSLKQVGSRAQRILLYPEGWGMAGEDPKNRDLQLLAKARDKYGVLLIAVDDSIIRGEPGPGQSWNTSTAKLLAFGQTHFDRIIHLDSDMTVLNNMDELFFLPPAPVAMPRAYWEFPERKRLSTGLIVLQPSRREYSALMDAAKSNDSDSAGDRYDMELLNDRYGDSALVLPHRQYGLMSGEFRSKDHKNFLGNGDEVWDPDRALTEAKFVHFSDWPLPKPWIMWPQKLLAEMQPKCNHKPGTYEESGCRDREVWKELYADFRKRRKVCVLYFAWQV